MSADPMPHSQVCLLVQCNSIRHVCWVHLLRYVCFVKCFSIRQDLGSVTNLSDMPTGKVPLPRLCKTLRLLIWTPSCIYQILSDACITSMGCYKDDVFNSRNSKISILHANPWRLSVSGKIFLYFSNKLPSWQPSCLHSYFIFFIWLQAKCPHPDSNFIANNIRKKTGLRFFSISRNFFTYI